MPSRPSPDDKEPLDDTSEEVGRSRTSLKKERVNNENALADLSQLLAEMNPDRWEMLGVPEDAIEPLYASKKIKAHGARGRHMRLIRATLRNTDWMGLRRRVDKWRAGREVDAPDEITEAQRWSEVLLIQGDPGLSEFLKDYPEADRGRLRQLVRNVKQAPEVKRGKVREQLERAVAVELEKDATES